MPKLRSSAMLSSYRAWETLPTFVLVGMAPTTLSTGRRHSHRRRQVRLQRPVLRAGFSEFERFREVVVGHLPVAAGISW
jgi:hypothetical protein